MPRKKTVIVTGGAGFIGSHVVDELTDRGFKVHVVDDLSTGFRSHVNRKAKLHILDIRSDRFSNLVKRLKPASVVHLAAHIDLRRSVEEPRYDADINIIGGLNVLEACRDAGVRHLVFASSAAVYGNTKKLPASESLPTAPNSPYGISKAVFEDYLRFAQDTYDIKCVSLRFANVYGPRQSVQGEAGVVAIFLSRLLSGNDAVINGDGGQTRDFIYVGDVARMVVIAVSRSLSGVYNVSTGKESSVNRLYREICSVSGIKRRAVRGPAKAGDERRVSLSPAKAKRSLRWKPKVSLKEGIQKTYDWWRKEMG
ncbi:MAG: GDP-mannose 4,6-dehydratase [Patescibacteria group bacterium]|nr:GDP-mannose 4,6-dehydratase [Patescibacteria group bacterium]